MFLPLKVDLEDFIFSYGFMVNLSRGGVIFACTDCYMAHDPALDAEEVARAIKGETFPCGDCYTLAMFG
jgi:Zn-finger protein